VPVENIGFVACDLEGASRSLVKECRELAESQLLVGRYVLLFWESNSGFDARSNWEGMICDEFLGKPGTRHEQSGWLFAANGAIRGYLPSKGPGRTILWILLRRNGPKPYMRVREISQEEANSSRLPVGDPVFTRDVANNVWHTDDKNIKTVLIERFGSLCAWVDESLLIINGSEVQRRSNQILILDKDPVPKALREPYYFKGLEHLI
jgi:hypothetical protein